MSALSVSGGGTIEATGAFPRQDIVGAAVAGTGTIDMRAVQVNNLGGTVDGDGLLLVRVEGALGGTVRDGGRIRYWGTPAVGRSIEGGGTIERGR